MWVLDASVAVRWFIENEAHPNADAVLRKLVDQPGLFAVPELFPFEVYAVLSRIHPNGQDAFIGGVMPILNSGVFRQPMTERLAEMAFHFIKKGLTGYDASYAALAQDVSGLWLTFDAKAHNMIAKDHVSHDLSLGLPEGWD